MGDISTELQQERREERRKRRKRNQFLAYLVVILFILIMAAGIVFGVNYLMTMSVEQEKQQEVQQSKVEDILKSEESIEAPEPEESTEPIVELTPEQKLDEIVNAAIDVMPIEDKVAGLFVVSPEAITGVDAAVKAGDGTRDALAQYAVGGLVYGSKNVVDAEQLKELLDNTRLYSKYPVFLATTEEGGKNSVLGNTELVEGTASAKELGETGDANAVSSAGMAISQYMGEYGFNLNLAPVADITDVDNSVIAKRSFGKDANVVSTFVNTMCKAVENEKITACVKYFPGMGSVTENPAEGKALTERSLEEFQQGEFQVFKSVIESGARMIMVSNISAPALAEDNTPCSMSENVVSQYLRGELGFQGIIISAPLNDKAVTEYYASDEAAIKALKAGCDMILTPEDFEASYEGVLNAVKEGTISEERINDALRRVYRVKFADRIAE